MLIYDIAAARRAGTAAAALLMALEGLTPLSSVLALQQICNPGVLGSVCERAHLPLLDALGKAQPSRSIWVASSVRLDEALLELLRMKTGMPGLAVTESRWESTLRPTLLTRASHMAQGRRCNLSDKAEKAVAEASPPPMPRDFGALKIHGAKLQPLRSFANAEEVQEEEISGAALPSTPRHFEAVQDIQPTKDTETLCSMWRCSSEMTPSTRASTPQVDEDQVF